MEPVRLALVGCGGWGEHLFKEYSPSPKVKTIACYDPDPGSAAAIHEACGARVHPTLESLLADDAVEAVLLVVPTFLHTDLGIAAAAAGKHVFVEKPIANHVAEGIRLAAACEAAGVKLAVGQSQRRLPAIRKMKALIDGGEIGRVIQAEGNFSHAGGMSLTPQHWRWYKEKCPGGPLNLLGVHVIDNLLYLLGPATEVTAFHGKGASPAEMDDLWGCVVRFESGVLANIGANYCTPAISFVSVFGLDGNLFHNRHGKPLEIQRASGESETLEVTGLHPLRVEVEDFAEAIREDRAPETSGPEGIAALAIVEAAVRSAYERRPVTVAEVMSAQPAEKV